MATLISLAEYFRLCGVVPETHDWELDHTALAGYKLVPRQTKDNDGHVKISCVPVLSPLNRPA